MTSSHEIVARQARRLLAAMPLLAALGCSPVPQAPAETIVVVTLDAARPDHLSAYGYGKPTTPNLEALAGDSTLVERAYSVSSWTLPAHASLLTGLYPNQHRTQFGSDVATRTAALGGISVQPLPDEFPTLAELLGAAGYATGAAVGGPWLHRSLGFARGFDFYEDETPEGFLGQPCGELVSTAVDWIERQQGETFLFLNLFDPHAPYQPPPEFAGRFGELASPFVLLTLRQRVLEGGALPTTDELAAIHAGYDAEIASADSCLGELVDGLQRMSRYDDALIIVTSDHGEEFGEEGGVGHNHGLSEAELRIPMIVKFPDGTAAGRDSEVPVSLVDVFPTVLRAAGVDFGEQRPGVPLHELLGMATHERPIFHEVHRNPAAARTDSGLDRDLIGVTLGRLRYLVSSAGDRRVVEIAETGTPRAVDIPVDPELRGALEDLVDAYREGQDAATQRRRAAPPADVIDRLRALGYIR